MIWSTYRVASADELLLVDVNGQLLRLCLGGLSLLYFSHIISWRLY